MDINKGLDGKPTDKDYEHDEAIWSMARERLGEMLYDMAHPFIEDIVDTIALGFEHDEGREHFGDLQHWLHEQLDRLPRRDTSRIGWRGTEEELRKALARRAWMNQ